MKLPPEPELRACLAVLRRVVVQGRQLAQRGVEQGLSAADAAQLAGLLDAAHNIPDLLTRWDECDEGHLLAELANYDEKWTPAVTLADEYQRVRADDGS